MKMASIRHGIKGLKITKLGHIMRNLSSANSLVNTTVNEKTGVATLAMNRPPVNSLNLELLQSFGQALDDLEKNKCRGMILTSESSSVFCAGLDITEMYKPNQDRVLEFWTVLQNTWLKLYMSSFPTVAAINGHSPAGGCLLAMSCEYRVMVEPKFTIGLNETKLGMIAPYWFRACMENVIGRRQTELALTLGKLFTAEEALRIGLVDELASDKADAISKAETFLDSFTKIPAIARKLTKLQYREPTASWLQKNRAEDFKTFLDYVSQPKVQQGLELYMQSLKKK